MMYDVVFKSGFIGFLIWLLLFITSTAAAALIIRCIWGLRRARFVHAAATESLLQLLLQGEWEEAKRHCGGSSALSARAAGSILETAYCRNRAEREEAATAALDREVRSNLRLINTLSLCGNIAPMLGLLGTVTGMVDAFLGLGTAMGPEKASVLAVSISQALYTTAAGLLIAVPAVTGSVIFRNLLETRTEITVETMARILDAIPEPEPVSEPEPEAAAPTGYVRTDTVCLAGE